VNALTMREFNPIDISAESAGPDVSVLMPAYNCRAFVGEAIASIQRQTLSNIEIVIVNDKSTDDTLQVVQSFAEADPRIRVINAPTNQGCAGALNLGLQHCRAPFIARMDADDVAMVDRLERQRAYLFHNPGVALVGGAVVSIDGQGRLMDKGRSPLIPIGDKTIAESLLFGPPCYHPSWFVRRELYAALQGYRLLIACEDYDFLLRAITSGYRLANLPDIVMKLRIRPERASSYMGLRQERLHRYVIRLYQERIKGGVDSFDAAAARSIANPGKLGVWIHNLGGKFVSRGFHSNHRSAKLFLLAVSAIVSPWHARYFFHRARTRWICRAQLRERL
jgi:glycosyltransferase involved in cell wall biosynthesis